jgi:hypothetical protein
VPYGSVDGLSGGFQYKQPSLEGFCINGSYGLMVAWFVQHVL